MLMIRNCNLDDYTFIKELWYKNRDTLSIPFKRCIVEMCNDPNSFIYEVDGRPIGMGSIKYMKRLKEFRIEHICIDSSHRGKGYGSKLLIHLVNSVNTHKNTGLLKPEIVAYARKGAKNNKFYRKYMHSESDIQRKTVTLIRFVLDERKLNTDG